MLIRFLVLTCQHNVRVIGCKIHTVNIFRKPNLRAVPIPPDVYPISYYLMLTSSSYYYIRLSSLNF